LPRNASRSFGTGEAIVARVLEGTAHLWPTRVA
jgi:hypothetical protein